MRLHAGLAALLGLELTAGACAERSGRHSGTPASVVTRAAQTSAVFVQVRDTVGRYPISYASVRIPELRLVVVADEEGASLLEGVRPGWAHIRVMSPGYILAMDSVLVRAGKVDTLRFKLRADPEGNPPDFAERPMKPKH